MNTDEVRDRLLEKRQLDDAGGCWLWLGKVTPLGYGQLSVGGRQLYTHRLAAAVWLGFDLDGPLCVLHRCDTPGCFNPEHLFVGTKRDNTRDMIAKGRARFPAGPPRRGSERSDAKLTEDAVREIRRRIDQGVSRRHLADEYGVSYWTVCKAAAGISWRHVR